jgi:hypothetical protein
MVRHTDPDQIDQMIKNLLNDEVLFSTIRAEFEEIEREYLSQLKNIKDNIYNKGILIVKIEKVQKMTRDKINILFDKIIKRTNMYI